MSSKKMSSKKKENIIIYGSLIAAIFCLLIAGIDYYHDLSNKSMKNEVSEALKELKKEETKDIKVKEDVESEELKNIDKKEIVKKYLDDIINQIKEDENISLDMLKSWGSYEIINMTYQKEIIDDYYLYITDIKIPNLNALLPLEKNAELSTNEYAVISIKSYISKSSSGYILKNFEI